MLGIHASGHMNLKFLFLIFLVSDFIKISAKTGCEMTYMYSQPMFEEIFENLPYSLYFYNERNLHFRFNKYNKNIIFVPGNAGSFKQGRSIGTIIYDKLINKKFFNPLNVLSANMGQEKNVLSGFILYSQLKFMESIIEWNHNNNNKSFIIIGHSLGGILAKRFIKDGLLKFIITLSTPHNEPVLWWDHKVYLITNEILRHSSHSNSPPIISICGGFRDVLVPNIYCQTDMDVNVIMGFNTESIPGVFLSNDHLSIVWCNQLLKLITRFINEALILNDHKGEPKLFELAQKYFSSSHITKIMVINDQLHGHSNFSEGIFDSNKSPNLIVCKFYGKPSKLYRYNGNNKVWVIKSAQEMLNNCYLLLGQVKNLQNIYMVLHFEAKQKDYGIPNMTDKLFFLSCNNRGQLEGKEFLFAMFQKFRDSSPNSYQLLVTLFRDPKFYNDKLERCSLYLNTSRMVKKFDNGILISGLMDNFTPIDTPSILIPALQSQINLVSMQSVIKLELPYLNEIWKAYRIKINITSNETMTSRACRYSFMNIQFLVIDYQTGKNISLSENRFWSIPSNDYYNVSKQHQKQPLLLPGFPIFYKEISLFLQSHIRPLNLSNTRTVPSLIININYRDDLAFKNVDIMPCIYTRFNVNIDVKFDWIRSLKQILINQNYQIYQCLLNVSLTAYILSLIQSRYIILYSLLPILSITFQALLFFGIKVLLGSKILIFYDSNLDTNPLAANIFHITFLNFLIILALSSLMVFGTCMLLIYPLNLIIHSKFRRIFNTTTTTISCFKLPIKSARLITGLLIYSFSPFLAFIIIIMMSLSTSQYNALYCRMYYLLILILALLPYDIPTFYEIYEIFITRRHSIIDYVKYNVYVASNFLSCGYLWLTMKLVGLILFSILILKKESWNRPSGHKRGKLLSRLTILFHMAYTIFQTTMIYWVERKYAALLFPLIPSILYLVIHNMVREMHNYPIPKLVNVANDSSKKQN